MIKNSSESQPLLLQVKPIHIGVFQVQNPLQPELDLFHENISLE